ncbi:MAG: hypothetical protein AB7I41_23030 [Candidatus Sericytochromatia bacterium]
MSNTNALNTNSERHRIPLNEQLVLLYHRTPSVAGLEATYAFPVGYAKGSEGLWHAFFRLLQRQLPPGWASHFQSTPDWTFFSLQAMPENRETFYEILQKFNQQEPNLVPWPELQQVLIQEAQFEQAKPEQTFESAFFQLAYPQTPYARSPLASAETFAQLSAAELLQASQTLFGQGTIYLKLNDSLPLPKALQLLEALLEPVELLQPPQQAFVLNSNEAVQETLEFNVPGGWVWQGFRVPGLLSEGWVHGLVLQHWLEQVLLLEGLPTGIDALECRWTPWMQGGLLYLVYHVAQAADLEKAKYHLMEWLLQAREGYLTPRRLRKAIHSCHSEWLQALQNERELSPVLRIEECLHGSSRFKHRLQNVSQDSLKSFWRQHLQADNLVTLEILHASARKQRYSSYREHFPALGYRPTVIPSPTRQVSRLNTAQKVDLGQGSYAQLLPVNQSQSLCLGAWFDQGSRHERMPGATALLFSLLAQRFDRLLQQQDASGAFLATHTLQWHVDRDFSGFYWHAPANEYRQALLLFRQLLDPMPPERAVFDRCKHQLLAQAMSQQLSLQREAEARFFQSGFGNHVYARPPAGDYFSLQALSPEDIQQTWQDLFGSTGFHPLLTGALPRELAEGLLPELFNRPISLEHTLPQPEKPLLLRRGEIQMACATPLPLRLEGRIFAESLPNSEKASLVLIESWLKQSLGQKHPGLGQFKMAWFEKAWLYMLMLPDTPETYLWRTQLSETLVPEFEIQLQNAAFGVRQLKNDLLQLWPRLARWEALGMGASSLLDLDKELLVLKPDQVQASLSQWFGERNEWLQIRLKAER